MNSSEAGKQMGLVKSDNKTGLSSLRTTIELPSRGDSTIPTILLFCSQGARLFNRMVANLAVHLDFSWLELNFIRV